MSDLKLCLGRNELGIHHYAFKLKKNNVFFHNLDYDFKGTIVNQDCPSINIESLKIAKSLEFLFVVNYN